jgi:hypothetical protein
MKSIRRSRRTSAIAQSQAKSPEADAFAVLGEGVYKDAGKKCEIHMYERRYNSRGEAILLQSGCKSELDWATENSIEAALVLTRYYTPRKELGATQLEIKSPYIKAALKEIVQSYPGVNIKSSGPISIMGDPMCLFHYRNELRIYASKVRDKNAKEHVTFLLQYMSKVLERDINSYEELMQCEGGPPGIEFQNLWMAFKPATLLYKKHRGVDILCRLRDITKVKPYQLPEYWRLESEIVGYDGKDLRFASLKNDIKEFDGYRPLIELELFPLEYHEDHENIRSTLLERGKKYITLLGIHHCTYDGLAELCSGQSRGWQIQLGQYSTVSSCIKSEHSTNIGCKIQDRIIIDTKEYHGEIQEPKLDFIQDSKVIRPDLNENFLISDEELLICTDSVPGFTLTTKRWALFNISNLKPVEYNKDAFASLLLPKNLKKTLSSLLKLQEVNSAQFDDFIEGKGKGLIVLLHGPPGVGKTFTAGQSIRNLISAQE